MINTHVGRGELIDRSAGIKLVLRESMASAVNDNASSARRPELLSKIDVEVNINDAILLATEDGLVTALDDRYCSSRSLQIESSEGMRV